MKLISNKDRLRLLLKITAATADVPCWRPWLGVVHETAADIMGYAVSRSLQGTTARRPGPHVSLRPTGPDRKLPS